MAQVIILGTPVPKQRPRVTRHGAYTPTKTVKAERAVKKAWIDKNGAEPVMGPVRLVVRAYFSWPKNTPKKDRPLMLVGKKVPVVKPDWDNIGKLISDALNEVAYHDDSQVVEAVVTKGYCCIPHTIVEVVEL